MGHEGALPIAEKLAAVRIWPIPCNSTDVKSFLGLCGFYQRFVTDYATVAAPLTDLMKKHRDWHWGEAENAAFEELKRRLMKHPVLIVQDLSKPLIVHTDASDVGLGATLSQHEENGDIRLVTCRSRKLSPAEKNYPVHEKEMLALVDSLEAWRHYLLGAEVHVYTDNSALRYLQKNPRPAPRQIRWLEKLQAYNLNE